MNYTEATRLSRQMSGGMTKTALEGWQRAGLGATGGGLLAYTMASLINPSMSRRGKILSTLAGMGTGAAAGYRFLPGYGSGKATAGTGNGGNAGNATTDTSTTTTQAKAPSQTAAQAPAQAPAQRPPRKLTPEEVERYGRRANNIINSIVEANEPFARDLPRLTLQYGPAAPVLTTLVGAGKRVLEAQMHKARAHRNGWDIGRTHLSLVPDDSPEPGAPEPAKAPAHSQEPTQATEPGPAENLGSLGTSTEVEQAPAPATTPVPSPAAAPAVPDQEDDDVSGAIYRTLGGLGLGLGGAGLYAGKKILKNRRVRQFGARRRQVREDRDTYAAWNAALDDLAHRAPAETPQTPEQAKRNTHAFMSLPFSLRPAAKKRALQLYLSNLPTEFMRNTVIRKIGYDPFLADAATDSKTLDAAISKLHELRGDISRWTSNLNLYPKVWERIESERRANSEIAKVKPTGMSEPDFMEMATGLRHPFQTDIGKYVPDVDDKGRVVWRYRSPFEYMDPIDASTAYHSIKNRIRDGKIPRDYTGVQNDLRRLEWGRLPGRRSQSLKLLALLAGLAPALYGSLDRD